MWHKPAIWIIDLERAAEPFVWIVLLRFTSPQINRAMVVFLDHAVSIAGINSYGDQIEQVVIAFFGFAQRLLRTLLIGDIDGDNNCMAQGVEQGCL